MVGSISNSSFPANVGILALEYYFPSKVKKKDHDKQSTATPKASSERKDAENHIVARSINKQNTVSPTHAYTARHCLGLCVCDTFLSDACPHQAIGSPPFGSIRSSGLLIILSFLLFISLRISMNSLLTRLSSRSSITSLLANIPLALVRPRWVSAMTARISTPSP